jgi:hypothetical protein
MGTEKLRFLPVRLNSTSSVHFCFLANTLRAATGKNCREHKFEVAVICFFVS